ncbi:hypothetical protein ACFO3K_11660 [Cellulomonas algicola]|uniref:Uncharacterized protein n=1 Tax=Cellulomonas algicola TaxID=2071633 RepID=A0A401UZH8_9CELL|nr:hypothetical protein [Cellulomonas algicola]GCD20099.1 hypothetical protein CTKZ_16610 [Cellulomonas algicola]
MGLFSRGRDRAADRPDPDLPSLSAEQADWLRARVVAELGVAGVGVEARGDHLVAADGQVYGLGNLAAMVATAPRRERDAVVATHVGGLLTMRDFREPETLEEITGIVVARVLPDDPAHAPRDPDGDAGPDLGPGLVVRACLDFPTHVSTVTDLAKFGGWAAVEPYATANLRALPAPDHQVLRPARGAEVHVFASDDLFGASRLLLLDDLLASHLHLERPAHGVLVAVPNRHLLALHVLAGPEVTHAMSTLISLARGEFDGPGPVSPEVFYRSPDGTLQQVTGPAEDGGVAVLVTGAFAEAMAALGLVG